MVCRSRQKNIWGDLRYLEVPEEVNNLLEEVWHVHRVAHADQQPLGEAVQRVVEVVLEPTVGAAGSEPQVRGVDERAAPIGE